jgi:hypothetical protein
MRVDRTTQRVANGVGAAARPLFITPAPFRLHVLYGLPACGGVDVADPRGDVWDRTDRLSEIVGIVPPSMT